MKLVELLVADYDAMVKPRRLEATSLVHASPAGPATPPLAAPTPARIQRALQRLGLPEGDDPPVASVAVEVRAPPPLLTLCVHFPPPFLPSPHACTGGCTMASRCVACTVHHAQVGIAQLRAHIAKEARASAQELRDTTAGALRDLYGVLHTWGVVGDQVRIAAPQGGTAPAASAAVAPAPPGNARKRQRTGGSDGAVDPMEVEAEEQGQHGEGDMQEEGDGRGDVERGGAEGANLNVRSTTTGSDTPPSLDPAKMLLFTRPGAPTPAASVDQPVLRPAVMAPCPGEADAVHDVISSLSERWEAECTWGWLCSGTTATVPVGWCRAS